MFVLASAATEIPNVGLITWLVPLVVIGIVVQFSFGTVVTIVLWRMSQTQRAFERKDEERRRAEDKRDAEIADLKKKLDMTEQERHLLVEKYVEKQLREMTHKIGNETNSLLLSLKDMRDQVDRSLQDLKQKMADAEKQIDSLGEGKHKLEMETLERLMELKDSVARRDDLQRHEGAVEAKFNELNDRINNLSENAVTKHDLNRLLRERTNG